MKNKLFALAIVCLSAGLFTACQKDATTTTPSGNNNNNNNNNNNTARYIRYKVDGQQYDRKDNVAVSYFEDEFFGVKEYSAVIQWETTTGVKNMTKITITSPNPIAGGTTYTERPVGGSGVENVMFEMYDDAHVYHASTNGDDEPFKVTVTARGASIKGTFSGGTFNLDTQASEMVTDGEFSM